MELILLKLFPKQKACAVYVSIFNNTDKDFIISSASSDISEKAEIHGIVIEKEITKMKKMENFINTIQATGFFTTRRNSFNVDGFKHQLKDGSSFDVRFIMGDGSFNEVTVMVLNKNARKFYRIIWNLRESIVPLLLIDDNGVWLWGTLVLENQI